MPFMQVSVATFRFVWCDNQVVFGRGLRKDSRSRFMASLLHGAN